MQRATKLWPGVAVLLGGLVMVTVADAAARLSNATSYHITGSATPIANPAQYVRTGSLNADGLPVTNPAYYVVQGKRQSGQWQYPFSVTVSGATVVTIPLAINRNQGTELVEVGVPTPTLLQWANPTHGGTSHRSTVAPPAR